MADFEKFTALAVDDIGLNDKRNFSCEKHVDGTNHVQELLQLWTRYTKILTQDDPAVRNIAAELCTLLVKTKSMDALTVFLEALPDSRDYKTNENIVRAHIHVAWHKKETKTVYKLIQENHFTDGEDLIKVWDEARYIDEERRTKKTLTPLSRFRVRKRYPPPNTICTDGVRKTNTLPREATSCLKMWLMSHINDPYPSATEKQQLAKISGLSQAQVKTWFANARRRSKNTEEYQRRYKNHWSMPVSECSSIISPPSSPASLPYSNNHHSSPYYLFGGDQLSHTDNNNQIGGSCHEYFQSLTSGYNRHERVEDYSYDHHSYPACNNARLCRSAEQSYYDVTSRFMLDVASKSHHYYEYPHLYY